MAITTSSILPAPVQQTFNYKLLAVPTPNMIHNYAAMRFMMPRNGGKTMRFRRYNPLQTAMVPLGNTGVTPPAQTLTAVDIDATISFYGTYILLNEQVVLQNQDAVLNEAALRLGVSLRQTEDQLTRDMLASTSAFINCVGGFNGDNPTEITDSDVADVVSTLLSNNAMTMTDSIEGEDKFGTAPIRNAYWAMSHSDLTRDLQNVPGFTHSSQYPSPMNILSSEWGAILNLRFWISSIGSKTLNASNQGRTVYNVFCAGAESYGIVDQDGYTANFLYRPPIYDGPLALNASVGYKVALVPRLLNDQWLINMRCTLSA